MSGSLVPRGPKHSSKLVRETQNNLAWWPSPSEPFHSSGSLVSPGVTQLTEENRFSCVGHLCTSIRAILKGNLLPTSVDTVPTWCSWRVVSRHSCARNTVPKLCDPPCFLPQLYTWTLIRWSTGYNNGKALHLTHFSQKSNFSSPVSHTHM